MCAKLVDNYQRRRFHPCRHELQKLFPMDCRNRKNPDVADSCNRPGTRGLGRFTAMALLQMYPRPLNVRVRETGATLDPVCPDYEVLQEELDAEGKTCPPCVAHSRYLSLQSPDLIGPFMWPAARIALFFAETPPLSEPFFLFGWHSRAPPVANA